MNSNSSGVYKPIYCYYANKFLEVANSVDFYKTFVNLPDGAYYIQPNGHNEWLIKLSGSGQFIDGDTVPLETRALHLLLTN